MKTIIKKSLLFIATAAVTTISFNSCTDLDETLYSELSKDNFYNNEREVLQAILRPFTHMQAWLAPTGQNGYYYHAELSSDLVAWPQKGPHGYDGGDHFRQHYHTWTFSEGRLKRAWELMWEGLGYINAAIGDMEDVVDKDALNITQEQLDSYKAELYVLRAFHYMKIMEFWGNVPIVTTVGEPQNPPTEKKEDVFKFIQTELETHVPKLQPYSPELVGRVSQAAGYAMLSELYLNAEYHIGTPMYDKCIEVCDLIIDGHAGGLNGGRPDLADNILESFSNTNQRAKEALFQFAFSRLGGFEFNWGDFYVGYSNMMAMNNTNFSGWNAFVVIPTAYDMFDDRDLRKKEWFLIGPQYKYGTTEPILGTEEYSGQPFVYVKNIRQESKGDFTSNGGMDQGEENSGARFNKYRSGTVDDPNYRENHYLIYRLTEIYYNKIEAMMRINGNRATNDIAALMNQVCERNYDPADWSTMKYDATTLTMDELLKERGREFFFEGKRRTDLIRFGKYVTAEWWDHTPSNNTEKELYPIPESQLGANPNLKQNPGYQTVN